MRAKTRTLIGDGMDLGRMANLFTAVPTEDDPLHSSQHHPHAADLRLTTTTHSSTNTRRTIASYQYNSDERLPANIGLLALFVFLGGSGAAVGPFLRETARRKATAKKAKAPTDRIERTKIRSDQIG